MSSYFRVQANPDLPRDARLEAQKQNKLVGRIFPSWKKADIARTALLARPQWYVVAECISVGIETF
jgi:hypothetical protein